MEKNGTWNTSLIQYHLQARINLGSKIQTFGEQGEHLPSPLYIRSNVNLNGMQAGDCLGLIFDPLLKLFQGDNHKRYKESDLVDFLEVYGSKVSFEEFHQWVISDLKTESLDVPIDISHLFEDPKTSRILNLEGVIALCREYVFMDSPQINTENEAIAAILMYKINNTSLPVEIHSRISAILSNETKIFVKSKDFSSYAKEIFSTIKENMYGK